MDWTVVELDNGVSLVTLRGRMDVAGALKADPAFSKFSEEYDRMIVDMSDLAFLASLGIRTLVTTCKALTNKGGAMVLLSPQANVEKVLHMSGIDTIIPIAHDRGEAEATALR